ncbi:MAG: ceramidase [Bacteriovoracaceae bacterium]|nr:ceramidase [Bacteriovoracaceae bacterium]
MYSTVREFTIEPSCPWYEAQQSYGPANVNWCEPTRCSWINEPANTWSNVPYMLVGYLIYKKLSKGADKIMRDLGLTIFVMGFFSFIYHATNNFMTQFFDFVGMYLMTSIVLAIQTQRIRGKDTKKYHSFFWAYMFLNTCIFWLFHINNIAIQETVILQGVAIFVAEFWGRIKSKEKASLKYFFLTLLFLAIAQTCSVLDLKRIYCEPDNIWLHGHAVWHMIGAIAMWMLALHVKSNFLGRDPKPE